MHSTIYQNSLSDAWPRPKGVIIFFTLSRKEALIRGRSRGIDLSEYGIISVEGKPHLWTVENLASIVPRDMCILGFHGLERVLPFDNRTPQAAKRFAYQVEKELAIPGLVVVASMLADLGE